MSNQGDDCYFYFYSTCNKGDSCSFRHCEAALGNETVCTLWQEGRCFRNICRFRHMEIDKKRSEIPCYWENQPVGCQKSNCAFHHTKGRYVDGLFLPPSKKWFGLEGTLKIIQSQPLCMGRDTSHQTRLLQAPSNLPFNTARDGAATASLGNLFQCVTTLTVKNFLLMSYLNLSCSSSNLLPLILSLHTLVRSPSPAFLEPLQALEDFLVFSCPEAGKSVLPLRRNLAERLGKKMEILENADKAPKREKAAKPAGEIHVKTLEEIRLERAIQRQGEPPAKAQAEGRCKAEDPNLGAKPSPAVRIKTVSGALAEKKQKQLEEEKQKTEEFPTKTKVESEPKKQTLRVPSVPSKVQLSEPAGKVRAAGEVHIKTLEEIKQEKALRMQQSRENVPAPAVQPEPAPPGRRLLRITKLTAPGREEKKIVELSKPPKAVSVPAEPLDQSATNSKVQVKSLEEIMKEKRQLKQRQEEKTQKEAAAVPSPGEKATKSKVCLKPLDGKTTSPTKQTLKRKAAESHPSAVAAVKPLSATGGDTKEPSAKKATVAVVPALPEDTQVSTPGRGKRKSSPELHLRSQAESVAQSEVSSSTSASSPVAAKTRRLSSTGAGKAPLSVEDDFEKLIWEISGGKLEAEIDLDPGKDEDDLLLELSEMIDS
ncbi:Zinc finger CCCH domain-containing protein 11A [Chaetura pelagica]|uniref:Zinc finger CCCH domain-containing protein 11A n=1 Tax=Chaetura pelagica TaxID=8897 RepID=A0A093BM48_CHAPE|nr:Zinc finger CCCH domain-containing protein 11A [Chaetura pelagica]